MIRISGTRSAGTTCCKLPVAVDILYSEFWKGTEDNTGYKAEMAMKNGTKLENKRASLQNNNGFIVNLLAEVHSNCQGISKIV